jgi:dTDP-glucose 4,6-dehydratase
MARLLVTGGAGFIGANFVSYWLDRHPHDRVVVLDSLTYAGNRASLAAAEGQSAFRFVQGDIRDQDLVESVLDLESIDTIVHFAAESHVDRSISGPDLFLDVNVGGTHSLLKAARNVWLDRSEQEPLPHRFHHVSTDEVYGSLGPDDPPFAETNVYAPNSPYAASKAAADHLVHAYHHTYGIETTISNCSNNYGPYQFPEKLIPLCIVCLLEGKELPIYGDGLQIRDWLHVDDHCRGIDRVLEKGQPGETYNIGTHNEQTNIDLVHTLCHILDHHFAEDPSLAKQYPLAPPAQGQTCVSRIASVKDRLGHDRRYAIDATRITQELGFSSKVPFEAGLEQTLRWYLTNEPWWRAVMDESYSEWIAKQYEGRELEGK